MSKLIVTTIGTWITKFTGTNTKIFTI